MVCQTVILQDATVLMNGGNAAHKIVVTGLNPTITFPSTWTHGTGDIFEFNQSYILLKKSPSLIGLFKYFFEVAI